MKLIDNKPKLVKRQDSPQDLRVSVCTDCMWGIFPQHNYIWTNRGLVHQKCEDKRLLDEITPTT